MSSSTSEKGVHKTVKLIKRRTAALLLMLLFVVSAIGCGEPILVEEAESVEDLYLLQHSARRLMNLFGAYEEVFQPEPGEEAFFYDLSVRLDWLLNYHEWMFDLSATELAEATELMNHIQYPDGREVVQYRVFGSNMNVFLLFSGPVWAEDAVCVGVGMKMADLFREPEWTSVVRISDPAWGGEYGLVWQAEEAGGPRYCYQDRGKTVTVRTNETGTLLAAEQVVYCLADGYSGAESAHDEADGLDESDLVPNLAVDFHDQRIIANAVLASSEFEPVRRYAAYLGLSEAQLRSRLDSSFQWLEREGRSWVASAEHRLELRLADGVCTAVIVPAQELIPHPSRSLTATELFDHWPVPVTVSIADDYRYEYYFNDFTLSVAAYEDGAVPLWETYPIQYQNRGPGSGYALLTREHEKGSSE